MLIAVIDSEGQGSTQRSANGMILPCEMHKDWLRVLVIKMTDFFILWISEAFPSAASVSVIARCGWQCIGELALNDPQIIYGNCRHDVTWILPA